MALKKALRGIYGGLRRIEDFRAVLGFLRIDIHLGRRHCKGKQLPQETTGLQRQSEEKRLDIGGLLQVRTAQEEARPEYLRQHRAAFEGHSRDLRAEQQNRRR